MVFEYSYGWILPAIVLALAVAYFKFKKLSKLPDIPLGIIFLISLLRFLVVFTLLLLLLNPALSLLYRIKEKPLLIVAQDNSSSLIKNKDSLYYLNEYRESLGEAITKLEEQFEVIPVTFGGGVKLRGKTDFTEKRTDITAVFGYADRQSVMRQPEGMILLSDGIYNSGINPRYKIPSFPVYTVVLGDTTNYPDVYIRRLEADKFNFLHTIFPVKAEVVALKQKGQILKCVLRENGKVIEEKLLQIDRDRFWGEVNFEVEAKYKGVMHYSVTTETGLNERTRENNKADTWVQILDNTGNIALFSVAPHPDMAAIVNAMNVSGMYRCTEHRFDEQMDTLKANLVILHNPDPGIPGYEKLIRETERRKIAVWYILTNRKSMLNFARYGNLYTTNFNSDLYEYATPVFNTTFPYFEFTEAEINAFQDFPPLTVPFGEISTGAGRVLFQQKIKNTVTNNSILAFYEVNGKRTCYFWGEGLWRWRLYSYKDNGNHTYFNTLIYKIVSYLATQKGTERFIHDIKPIYGEGEETVINAELYNDSYELVNTPEVKLNLKYEKKDFDYVLNRNGEKYKINLGNLPVGEYYFTLTTDLKGEKFEKKGKFYVQSNTPELNELVANRTLLEEIAVNSGGQIYEKEDIHHLVKALSDNKIKPVYRDEVKFIELRGMEILGLILLVLLCLEWFLLKYYAG